MPASSAPGRVTQLCSRHPGFPLASEVVQPCEKKTLCSLVLRFSSAAAASMGRGELPTVLVASQFLIPEATIGYS